MITRRGAGQRRSVDKHARGKVDAAIEKHRFVVFRSLGGSGTIGETWNERRRREDATVDLPVLSFPGLSRGSSSRRRRTARGRLRRRRPTSPKRSLQVFSVADLSTSPT